MKNALKQEIYKFTHAKIAFYGLLTLLLTTVYSALTARITKSALIYGFGSLEWIPIIIIAIGSAFFALEYSNNTIVMMLYKNTNKSKIYFAKFFVVFLFSIVLAAFAILLTLGLSFLLAPGQYHWLADFNGHKLLTELLLNMLGAIAYCFFSVGLSFMLIMIFKVNAVVICVGIVLAFFGASFSVALMQAFPSVNGLLKWNPLNMIFISQQLTKTSLIAKSHLTNPQLLSATLVYGLVFGAIGYYLFKHRRI